MLSEHGVPRRSPREALGSSFFDPPESEWRTGKTTYRPASRMARQFADLARDDPSFGAILIATEYIQSGRSQLSQGQRAADVESLPRCRPVVFRKEESHSAGRSRRVRIYIQAQNHFSLSLRATRVGLSGSYPDFLRGGATVRSRSSARYRQRKWTRWLIHFPRYSALCRFLRLLRDVGFFQSSGRSEIDFKIRCP